MKIEIRVSELNSDDVPSIEQALEKIRSIPKDTTFEVTINGSTERYGSTLNSLDSSITLLIEAANNPIIASVIANLLVEAVKAVKARTSRRDHDG